MQQVEIAYGGGGHQGVTQLMSVGADEYPAAGTEKLIKYGELVALSTWAMGYFVLKSNTVSKVGLGAAVALFLVDLFSRQGVKDG